MTFGTLVISESTETVESSIGVMIGGVIGAVIFIIMFTLFVVFVVVFAVKWRRHKGGTRSQGTLYSSCTTININYQWVTCIIMGNYSKIHDFAHHAIGTLISGFTVVEVLMRIYMCE